MKLGDILVDPDTLNYYMSVYSDWLGMPSDTLLSVAMMESAYDPNTGNFRNVCNASGACGLMQMKPIALQDIRQKWGYNLDPMDPVQSIVAAALLFRLNRIYIKYTTGIDPDPAAQIVAFTGGWVQGKNFVLGKRVSNAALSYLSIVGGRVGIA